LADHLIIECQSTANALAVRLTGKAYGKSRGLIPDQSPERFLVHTSDYRA
jgi:hypothetical protein